MSRFILNGVAVIWKGSISLEKLEGMGHLEFDEERAEVGPRSGTNANHFPSFSKNLQKWFHIWMKYFMLKQSYQNLWSYFTIEKFDQFWTKFETLLRAHISTVRVWRPSFGFVFGSGNPCPPVTCRRFLIATLSPEITPVSHSNSSPLRSLESLWGTGTRISDLRIFAHLLRTGCVPRGALMHCASFIQALSLLNGADYWSGLEQHREVRSVLGVPGEWSAFCFSSTMCTCSAKFALREVGSVRF